MKIPAIDEPIRLGKIFWAVYGLMAIPSLWLLKPWSWGPPLISEAAGFLLPPFLAGIALYSFALFTRSLISNLRGQKKALAAFAAAIVGPTVFLVAAWIFSGYQNLPAICAFVASFIGHSLLYFMLRKEPNQPPEPTRAFGPSGSS
jgi:hypothetical protein